MIGILLIPATWDVIVLYVVIFVAIIIPLTVNFVKTQM